MGKKFEEKVISLPNKEVKKIAKKFFKTILMKRDAFESKDEFEDQFSEFKSFLLSKITLQTFVENIFMEEFEADVAMKDYIEAYNYIMNAV